MPKVLYIEDNFDNRLLVRRILMASDHGFDIVDVDNAKDGIEIARANPPDIILMDVSMPEMDGLSATRQLREIEELKTVPIVAITANAMEGDRERTLNAGCDGYIRKPIDVDKLPDQILAYIRSRNERSARREADSAD
ncbi:MAG: response regulator [Chloroflexota bacterium]|nr:MAG: response regulator [Chloroflexota bacterium]